LNVALFGTLGYSVRPLTLNYKSGSTMVHDINIPLPPGNTNTGGYWINGIHYSGYPKINKFKAYNAIAADVVTQLTGASFSYDAQYGSVGHLRKGVNVCYSDGSVSWVPFDQFKTSYADGTTACLIYQWDSKAGVWYDYDQYRK
jgi:hypothetical protein